MSLDYYKEFRGFLQHFCLRPNMYLENGEFDEALHFLYGYGVGRAQCDGSSYKLFDAFQYYLSPNPESLPWGTWIKEEAIATGSDPFKILLREYNGFISSMLSPLEQLAEVSISNER